MLEFELVLPCYNEGKTLGRLIDDVIAAAQGYGFSPDRFQLVLVQNGSTDETQAEAVRLFALHGKWFRIVEVTNNQGYGHGLVMGLKATTAPFVAWSHADLQCSPKDAFKALEVLRAVGVPTLVRGYRTDRAFRDRVVSRVFELLSRMILGMHETEINAQPKVFARAFLNELKNAPKHFGFDLYALYRARRAGYQQRMVGVSFPPRVHGVSNWAGTLFQRHRTILGMIRYMWLILKTEGRLG